MESNHLSPVQGMILEILEPIYQYLQKNDMEYFMLGGTLLGAIRHKGFIPWDDDIDIGIPREQYERFLKEIQAHLPEHLKLETYQNTPSHHYYFCRVVDTRHSLVRTGSTVERSENVWVDVFPIDGMPNSAVRRRLHMWHYLVVRALYHISCFDKVNLQRPNRPLSERIVIKFIQVTGFGKNMDTKKRLEKLDKLSKKYPYQGSDYVANLMGQYKFKEMFPVAWYGKGKLYPFEQYMLMGPENYDAVLRQMYGDYMTPPKEQDRNAHAAYLRKE